MNETESSRLAKKIIDGYRITRGNDLSLFLTAPLDELSEGARMIQERFCGKHIDLSVLQVSPPPVVTRRFSPCRRP